MRRRGRRKGDLIGNVVYLAKNVLSVGTLKTVDAENQSKYPGYWCSTRNVLEM